MILRKYLLDAALERVLASMNLRRPQHDALQEFHKLIGYLPDNLGSVPVAEVQRKLQEYHPRWSLGLSAPHMSFALATGVGKSRLMAALIAYLSLGNQSKNFVLLAPRRTVLDKFLRELSPASDRFLFVDPSLIPDLRIWHSDNISSFRDKSIYETLFPEEPVNVFVLSPQSLVGDDRKIADVDEFSGVSVLDWLRETGDLVVLSDEAHHFGALSRSETAAWTDAVRDLAPKMHLLFTATPRSDANELYTYDLATCLQEKLYTKDVRVITKQRPKSADLNDDDWDRVTAEFALTRLAQKKAAIVATDAESGFPPIEPVMLVCCADTNHADATAKWLAESGHLRSDEILIAHSKRGKSEEDFTRLLNVDKVGSKIRAVITVFQLTEGWDVSNVFVIVPLRAMSTFSGAVQSLGRGLRLPAGKRIEDPELDTLDVLCFGRETLDEILAEATDKFGDRESGERGIVVSTADDDEFNRPVPTRKIILPLLAPRILVLPRMRIKQTEPDLDFEPILARKLAEIAAQEFSIVARVVKKADDSVRLPRPAFVAITVQRVISNLTYLSLPLHASAVSTLVDRFLDASSIESDADLVAYDWRLAGDLLSRQIDVTYRKTAITSFEAVGSTTVEFRDQTIYVPEEWMAPLPQDKLGWSASAVRRPIDGWHKCTHGEANFDTGGEFHAARLLDRADLDWWLRNDPAIIRVATPIGFYGPDFVISRSNGTKMLLLEIKRSDLWEAPDSDARIKATAADAYCAEVSNATAQEWEHWVVLDEDTKACASLEEMSDLRVNG